jgi:hypothetical protein
MEKDRNQRYADSLARTIQNHHHFLKKTVEDFQEMCRLVSPNRNVPREIIVDARELYKEIRNRLKEIKAIQQVLIGKYRQYYHRDSLRDKEILEFGFIAKGCYSKLEHALMQIELNKIMKDSPDAGKDQEESFPWFRSGENRAALLRKLQDLGTSDPQALAGIDGEKNEQPIPTQPTSLIFFVFSGSEPAIDKLQSQLRLREQDLMERYDKEELRGLLTPSMKMNETAVEKMFQQVIEKNAFSKLKCLLFSISFEDGLQEAWPDRIDETLKEMQEGELKTLSSRPAF